MTTIPTPRKESRRRADLASLLAGLLFTTAAVIGLGGCAEEPPPPPAPAAKLPQPAVVGQPAQPPEVQEVRPAEKVDTFVYRREGRPDPFMPFVTEKVVRQEVEPEVLTGMRQFEPGQLSLVAIVFQDREGLAMVQDSVGKGYIIRPGTLIGRAGVVAQILPNQVLIHERYHTMAGEERIRPVEMLLKKERDLP